MKIKVVNQRLYLEPPETAEGTREYLKAEFSFSLVDKYKDFFSLVYEGCPYNLDEWEKVFEPYSYLTFGHDVSRKMGLCKQEKDGLLVVMNIILQEISARKYK